MCQRFSPLPLTRSLRRRVFSWHAAIALSGLIGCSSGSASPTADGASADVVSTDTVAPAADTGADAEVPTKTSGDPIESASSVALGPSASLSALAAQDGSVYALDGAAIVALDQGVATAVYALDAPGIAIARLGAVTYAVDTAGTWYRFEGDDAVTLSGPVVQRLRVGPSGLIGLLGRGGLVTADLALAAAPKALVTVAVARDVAFGDDYWLVAAEDDGVAAVAFDGTVLATFPTEFPVTAIGAFGPNRFLAIESGAALDVLEVSRVGTNTSIDYLGGADYAGLGLAVASNGAHALVADWHGVTAFDLADLAAPTLLGREPLTRGAMDLAVVGADYVVRGLDSATLVSLYPGRISPELSLSPERIQIESSAEFEGGSSGLLIKNTGQETLHLRDLAAGDARVSLTLPTPPGAAGVDVEVAPDDVAFLELAVTGVEPFETTLSFGSDDPSQPTVTVPVAVNPKRLEVGDVAPDFTLPSTAGVVVALAQHRGEVVFVKLFNRY